MPETIIKTVWDELAEFMADYESRFDLSFGLEYSSVVEWVADITPRRGHAQARDYPLWQYSAMDRDDAIRGVIARAREGIAALS